MSWGIVDQTRAAGDLRWRIGQLLQLSCNTHRLRGWAGGAVLLASISLRPLPSGVPCSLLETLVSHRPRRCQKKTSDAVYRTTMASQSAGCGGTGAVAGVCSCSFHLALEDFKKRSRLGPEELQAFETTRLHELRSAIATIQREQESKRRLRYMRRLEPFLQTMEQYGKVVEVFVNTSDIVAFLWVRRNPNLHRR